MRILSIALAVLLVSVNVQAKQVAAISPQEVPQTFYNWVLTHRYVGLPSSKQMQQLTPMLSYPVSQYFDGNRAYDDDTDVVPSGCNEMCDVWSTNYNWAKMRLPEAHGA